MKKVLFILSLMMVMVAPMVAVAGTAYIPLYIVNSPANVGDDYIGTGMQISSIVVHDQEVRITLYDQDGNLNVGQPFTCNKFVSNATNAEGYYLTDSNGQVVVPHLSGNATLHVVLKTKGNGISTQGHGVIKATLSCDPLTQSCDSDSDADKVKTKGTLVANAFIRNNLSATYVNDTSYQPFQRAITINGGNPF